MAFAAAGLFIVLVLATDTLLPGDLIFVEMLERLLGRKLDGLRAVLSRRIMTVSPAG